MNITDEQKIKKFDELMVELDKFESYRSNLSSMVMYGSEIVLGQNEGDNPGSYTTNTTVKKLTPDQIKSIYHEINRLDNVISFISNIIHNETH